MTTPVTDVSAPKVATLEVTGTPGVLYEIVGRTGPQGPPGPAGDLAAAGYRFTQAVAATVWLIEHNLGYDPAGVAVLSDGYTLDEFGIDYPTPGVSVRLSFDISVAGVAYLS